MVVTRAISSSSPSRSGISYSTTRTCRARAGAKSFPLRAASASRFRAAPVTSGPGQPDHRKHGRAEPGGDADERFPPAAPPFGGAAGPNPVACSKQASIRQEARR
jgi:hypothetical protein